MTSIATLGSHCALQVLKGAKDEGFKTILVCEKKREKLYRRFKFIDELIIVEKFSDILEFLEIIRRNRIEISPSDDFVNLLLENINKFDGLEFEEYTKLLGQLDSNLSKKDIFMNTRYLLTGNNNGPSVKNLFEYYGINQIKNYLNDFKTL